MSPKAIQLFVTVQQKGIVAYQYVYSLLLPYLR
ncbi:hypothetical protein FLLO111716_00485 [Flavobacterium longum]